MVEEQAQDHNAFSTGFGTRINEIEEKQRLLKDRILLIGENLISFREEFLKTESNFKKQMKQSRTELESMKRLLARIINEMSNFARKPELEIFEKQMKMFEPLELARIKDVKNIVKEELKKQNQ